MAKTNLGPPDFFEETPLDPVGTAVGATRARRSKMALLPKRKAGFYLSEKILKRFDRKYHELKLQGCGIENKSALLEAALNFALDDIDREGDSRLLDRINACAADSP